MDIPTFIAADPIFWFTLVESIFTSHKTTNVRDKLNAILLALPNHLRLETKQFLSRLADIADDNTAEKKKLYEEVKKKIISITSIPEEQRLKELLHETQIGTRSPSQFLNHLRNLQGDAGDRNDKYIRWIFLQNLPTDIRNIIISQQKDNLDDMATTADLIWRKPNVNIANILSKPPFLEDSENSRLIQKITEVKSTYSNEIRELKQSIATLTKQMENMLVQFSGSIDSLKSEIAQLHEKPWHFGGQLSNSQAVAAGGLPGIKSGNLNFNSWCYFHQRFGNTAFKCTQPCTFNHSSQGNW